MKIRSLASLIALSTALLTVGSVVHAQAITPTGTFGPQPGMTFGGTGIPNDAVMVNSDLTASGVTLGLTAHQRYANPALTNNNLGTFYAMAGVDQLNAPSPTDPYAVWNFGFFVGGGNRLQYTYKLFYDFNPLTGNDQSTHGVIGFSASPDSAIQNSWNLGMNFLADNAFWGGNPPPVLFDPNAVGQYTFALAAFSGTTEVTRSAIQVNVGTQVVPEPSTYAMMTAGLAGIFAVARRRKNKSSSVSPS
mgnify:CR=1 FL=1